MTVDRWTRLSEINDPLCSNVPWRRANVGGRRHAGCMRPALKMGLRPLWRDEGTLQIGVDPRRARALTRLGKAAAVVSLLDGSRDTAEVAATAETYGIAAADRSEEHTSELQSPC